MFKNFDIAVDTTKGVRNQAISVNTNDLQTLQFSFTITQSGVPVNLTGATVRLAVKKPDKKTVFQDCTISDAVNGKCEIILDTQAYIVPGLHPVELMIYYAVDKVSVTGRFSYTANKGILDDGSVVSTNEFQAINQALTDVESIVVDLRENGTGIDAQARTDLQTVTTQLADTAKKVEGVVNVKDWVKGDGTNETALLKTAINYAADNHLRLDIPKEMTILIDYMIIANKNNFSIKCDGVIKRLDNAPTTASLIRFDVCSDIHIPNINFDGNALNNGCSETVAYTVNQEQKHTLAFTSCTNVNIDRFYVKNPCGDGIYISTNSKKFTIGKLLGKADARIGRNIISFINAQDVFIDLIDSDGIGHYDMPGGFDIEPNGATEVVKNIFVNNMNIRSGGSNILSVLNTNGATVENVFIDKANIISDSVVNPNPACVILAGQNVTINQLVLDGGSKADLIKVDTWDDTSPKTKNITVRKVVGKNGYRGLLLGFNRQVLNVDIKATFTNCGFDGVALFWVKGAKLDLDIDSVKSDRFMINAAPGAGTLEDITISGNISKRGTGLKAIISNADPAKIINWTLKDLDFTGWTNDTRLYGGGMQGTIRKINCPNLTHMTALPAFENYKQGDVVVNVGTDNAVSYWRRLTNGTGNVINTDWKVY